MPACPPVPPARTARRRRFSWPLLLVLVAAVAAVSLAGCGGSSLGPSAATLADGSEVSPRQYLADVDSAAVAIRDFSDVLEQIGPVARPATLRELAPTMAVPLQQADTAVARLKAQRLADARLEAQRQRAVPVLERVVAAMTGTTTRAAAGQPEATAAAVAAFGAAVEELRALPADG